MTIQLPDPYVGGPGAIDEPPEEKFDGVQRNFDAIKKLLIDTGGQSVKLRFGTGTLTWPGAASKTNVLTVNHGLGTTPIGVLATAIFSVGAGAVIACDTGVYTSTQFNVQGEFVDGFAPVASTTTSFVWFALG